MPRNEKPRRSHRRIALAKPTNSCEVFLSHSSSDKPAIERIALRLQEKGVSVWLDKWNLVPGEPWQPAIEEALSCCASVAVFIGPKGLAPWHHEEMRAAIQRRVAEPHFRVIPVLLAEAPPEERNKLPPFLKATTWVEFPTEDDDEAMRKLSCGIRGEAPGPAPTGAMPLRQSPVSGIGRRLALMLGIALAAAALLIVGNHFRHRESPVSPTTPVGAAATPTTSTPRVGAATGTPAPASLPPQQAIADGDAGRMTGQA